MAVINLKMDGGPFGIIFWNESLYSKNVISRAKPVVPVRHFHWAPKNPGKLRSFIPLRIKSPFIGGPELSGNSWRIFSTRRLVCIRRIITFQSKKLLKCTPTIFIDGVKWPYTFISPWNQWSYGPLLIYNWFFGTHLHWSGLYFFLWFLLMWEDRPSLVNFPTTSPQRATWKWSKLALTCCVFYFVFLVSLTSQLYRDYWWTLVRIALKMNQWGFPWNVSQGLCFRCSLWKICRRSPHHPLQVLGSFHRPKLQRTLPQTSLGWFWTWDSF